MNMNSIIIKKKNNVEPLTDEEIQFFVDGFTNGTIPDYQVSALLMAICINKMNEKETFKLTDAMLHSGDIINLSKIKGVKVDKHSTGGVGDSTSIALAPILACLDLIVAKMSGRGLGFSGGTIDKLESIPGFSCSLSKSKFEEVVNTIGCSIIGQTNDLAPADKKLYGLRDVTGTVENVSLIASSIMSKKLASGTDVILLDVKFGSGAFMKTEKKAIELAELMVKIGTNAGKKVGALITSMQQPLGNRAGNSLEILNVIEVLQNKPSRLRDEIEEVAVKLLILAEKANNEKEAFAMVRRVIKSGEAMEKLIKMVELHGGDSSYIKNPKKIELGEVVDILSEEDGYISKINTENIGRACVLLGGGRMEKTDTIDNRVGVEMLVELGSEVKIGTPLIKIYHTKKGLDAAKELIKSSFKFNVKKPNPYKIAVAYVDAEGVKRY